MNLTDPEKLILVMLSEIHARLGIENGIDPTFVQEAIFRGHSWALKWHYPGIFDSKETSPSVVDEAISILDMWAIIEHSYEQCSAEDKKRVEKEAEPFGRHIHFSGFDGNYEGEYMDSAKFLVEKLDRFTQFKGRDFNSHMPSIKAYRRMIQVYHPIRDVLEDGTLSAEQLIDILKARLQAE